MIAILLWKVLLQKVEMVFCYQNCSDLQRKKCSIECEKRLKFEAEGREFANFLRLSEQFIQTVRGQNHEPFLVTECFFNLFLEVSHI